MEVSNSCVALYKDNKLSLPQSTCAPELNMKHIVLFISSIEKGSLKGFEPFAGSNYSKPSLSVSGCSFILHLYKLFQSSHLKFQKKVKRDLPPKC